MSSVAHRQFLSSRAFVPREKTLITQPPFWILSEAGQAKTMYFLCILKIACKFGSAYSSENQSTVLAFVLIIMLITENINVYVLNVHVFKETVAKFITEQFRPG